MGISEKMWDAIATVIRMNDKVERLAAATKTQQAKIEHLVERVIRLETALVIALQGTYSKVETRRLEINE